MREHEKPVFDGEDIGWTSTTRHGMVWRLFPEDSKQFDDSLYFEACEAVNEIIRTGAPLVGGWR